jgi:hypothetical protein
MAIIVGKFNSERNGSPHFMGKNGEHGYRFESLPPLQLYPDYIQIISRLYPAYIQIISRLYPDYIPIDG